MASSRSRREQPPDLTVRVRVFGTPWGWVRVAGGARGLIETSLPAEEKPPGAASDGAAAPGSVVEELLERAQEQLGQYLAGQRRQFDLPLDLSQGTAFQQRVWAACAQIPYGETVSYRELARRAGLPGRARGVGQAMARNPLPLVVPCHRVVGADGRLVGFGGGLALKRRLLALERAGE